MRWGAAKPSSIGGAGYAANTSIFVVSWLGRPRYARIHPLTIQDLDRHAQREWRRGHIIDWVDLQDYVRHSVTLVMKGQGRALGVLHLRAPRLRSLAQRPEVVALEANPQTRSYVRGVGTGLIAAAVMVSKEWGYGGALELTAAQRAIRFYTRLGMRRKPASRNRFYFSQVAANRFLRAYLRRLRLIRAGPTPHTVVRIVPRLGR